MSEQKSLFQYQEEILARLKELAKMDFPQYRTYKRPDGTWVDREPVPEYLEQEKLTRIWREIQEFENWFHLCHNHLLVSLRLWQIADNLQEVPPPIDLELQWRIAYSVYTNSPVPLYD